MKDKGVIRYETEGRHAGCWVMPFESHTGTDEHESDKIIVRSNGTVTYTGKDIAYQLWKLGKLGLDFHYKVARNYPDGQTLWTTKTEPEEPGTERPRFGGGIRVYNVIDSRQSYPQEIVARGVAAVVPEVGEDASVHFSYEMVALSPAACDALGIELSDEDRTRPYIEMSGRKGLGVKADDLIDRLTDKASQEVASRNPEFSAEETRRIAESIAIAAVRYFMVKFSRGKVIVFDIDEALSFEGESGPYLQYAVVRGNNIFNKLRERLGLDERAVGAALGNTPAETLTSGSDESHEVWGLILEAARLDEVVDQAVRTLELSVVAKYAFSLAQSFNAFYHRYPILNEENANARIWRAAAVAFCRNQLGRALDLMGCTVPVRM
jgi:arginyl-tRNA synthetase